jgi:hypothetical protein
MANRNHSDVRQHETLPGPGPGGDSMGGASGVRPVEQMVDAGIERNARDVAREKGAREKGARENGAREQVALQRVSRAAEQEATHEIDLALYETDGSSQLANKLTRLRWKGLDVSDEFRSYAERVARGEDLPPFEGRVLAEPNVEFPWGRAVAEDPDPYETRSGRGSRLALWASAAAVLGLLAWSVAVRLEAPVTPIDTPSAVAASSDAPTAASVVGDSLEDNPENVVDEPARGAPEVPSQGGVDPGAVASGAGQAPASELTSADHAAVGAARTPEAVSSAPTLKPQLPTPAATAGSRVSGPDVVAKPVLPAPSRLAAAPVTPKPAAPVTATAAPDDDFGILPLTGPASASTPNASTPNASTPNASTPSTSTPTNAPATSEPVAPVAAKSEPPVAGSVGDLARVGQPGPVRKQPGSASSAKGSLLVETPSF